MDNLTLQSFKTASKTFDKSNFMKELTILLIIFVTMCFMTILMFKITKHMDKVFANTLRPILGEIALAEFETEPCKKEKLVVKLN